MLIKNNKPIISKEEFIQLFEGTQALNYVEILYAEKVDIRKAYRSKLWRISNLYFIIDKHANKVKFKLNRAQWIVLRKLFYHKRLIILKTRQLGISTLFLVLFFDDVVTKKNMSIGMMAQSGDPTERLFNRTKFLWDTFPLKEAFGLKTTSNSVKKLSLNNNSTMLISTSFRSDTLQRLHISEFGAICNATPYKANETVTGSMQTIHAGSQCIIESTARGVNLFKDMWDKAVEVEEEGKQLFHKDFHPVFLSWLDDPDWTTTKEEEITLRHREYFANIEKEIGYEIPIDKKWYYIGQERELGVDLAHQEYPCLPDEAFEFSSQGLIFAHLYRVNTKKAKPTKIITNTDPDFHNSERLPWEYDPNIPLQVAMDIGLNDYNAVLVFQLYKNKRYWLECFYKTNEPTSYYSDAMKEIEKYWGNKIEVVILPHDAFKRGKESETLETVYEQYQKLGWNIRKCKRLFVKDGIEGVKTSLVEEQWYVNKERCEYFEECMLRYSRKYDEKMSIWTNEIQDNRYKHGADAVRYAVQESYDMGIRDNRVRRSARDLISYDV